MLYFILWNFFSYFFGKINFQELEERIQELVSRKLEIEKSLDDRTSELATLEDEKKVLGSSQSYDYVVTSMSVFVCLDDSTKFCLIFKILMNIAWLLYLQTFVFSAW